MSPSQSNREQWPLDSMEWVELPVGQWPRYALIDEVVRLREELAQRKREWDGLKAAFVARVDRQRDEGA